MVSLQCGDFFPKVLTLHTQRLARWTDDMMTSWNGNNFRVTVPLYGEFTGHRWIPLTKASDTEFDIFFDLRLEKPVE